ISHQLSTLSGSISVSGAALIQAQVAYIVGNCRARALILADAGRWPGDAAGPVVLPAAEILSAPPTGPAPEAAADPGGLAMIIYTSGSTGPPKGVMLSHHNIRLGAESVIAYLGLDQDDRLLSLLPYSFDAGLNQLTTMLMTGGTTVHQPVVMPSEVIRMAHAHAVTGIAGVPPLWNQIVRYLVDSPCGLPALRRVTNTGGKIPPDILAAMPQVFPGADIFLMYGLTEAFRSTYLPPQRFKAKMGSIGQAIPNAQVFVIREGEGVAGPGQQGELVHAGPLISLGYWESPELTAQKIRPCPELAHLLGDAPVVWSGDIVRVDEDGDLWFVSRRDDMIKTQGFRVSPTEVEDAVSASGMAGDIVAFAVDDDARGQAIHVAVTPLEDTTADGLMAHCRRMMPSYMVPDRIHLWPGPMPRTASGKLDRPLVIAAGRQAAACHLPPAA
ncbi:MAG TPA: AMP-binding protein, partial [Paracoccus sp. (in: a-proteobacteria)]|nr:AMP-binding protein [Paracoccus sp. (in: a-proteobacteria)]